MAIIDSSPPPRRRRSTARTEAERFWDFVLKGPAAGDCWLWTGAIADDGYGRFWTAGVDGKQKIVRPQRYAYTALTGRELTPDVLILHRCYVPLCVHADVDPEASLARGIRPTTCRTALGADASPVPAPR